MSDTPVEPEPADGLAAGRGGVRAGDPAFRRMSVALFAAGLATFALLYAPQPLLPELSRTFGVSAGRSALAISCATFALGIALLVVGPVSEVRGRTRLMHASLWGSSLVGLLCAVAPTWPALLALRGLQGFVLAGLPAIAVAYLREEVDPAAHARATGLYIGGTALGGMVGRLLAAGLADVGGWRVALAGVGVLGVVCAAVTLVLLPPSRRFVAHPAHPRALLRTSLRQLRDPVLLGLFALALLLMGSFVAVFNATGFRLESPPYSLSVAAAGLVFTVYAFGTVGSTAAGAAADRYGRRRVVPFAVALMLAGLLVTLASPLWVVVVGLSLLTGGFFAAHGVASGWVAARADRVTGGTAQATSTYLFAYYLGSSVVGALAGVAWESGGWPEVVAVTGALVVVALGVSLALRRAPSR